MGKRVIKKKGITLEIDDTGLEEIRRRIAEERVDGWEIHDGVEYGVYQELTERGHPSLVPAFERIARTIPRSLGKAIEMGVSLNDIIRKSAFDIVKFWADDVNVDTGAYKNSITADKL